MSDQQRLMIKEKAGHIFSHPWVGLLLVSTSEWMSWVLISESMHSAAGHVSAMKYAIWHM